MKLLYVIASIGLASAPYAAEAQSYSQQTSLSTQSFSDLSADSSVINIMLPSYNSAAGPLGSVTVTVAGFARGMFAGPANSSVIPPNSSYVIQTGVEVFSPASPHKTVSTATYLAGSSNSVQFGAPYSLTFTDYDVTDYLLPRGNVFALTEIAVPTSTIAGVVSDTGSLSYQITETFNVPEPASLALLGFASLAMLGIRYRRNAAGMGF